MSDLHWRPTRLEATDPATLSRAVVEEVPGRGWSYAVWRGSRCVVNLTVKGKTEAISRAVEEMRGRGRGFS